MPGGEEVPASSSREILGALVVAVFPLAFFAAAVALRTLVRRRRAA
jgi:hypothetical protein